MLFGGLVWQCVDSNAVSSTLIIGVMVSRRLGLYSSPYDVVSVLYQTWVVSPLNM